MTRSADPGGGGPRPDLTADILRRFAQVIAVMLVNATLLFVSAGDGRWTWAWAYLAIHVAGLSVSGVILLRTSPGTIAERARAKETRDWDKIVGGLWALISFAAIPVLAGLDHRFTWTRNLPGACNAAGGVGLAAGLALAIWAMVSNAWFSTAVRIQSDRGHAVCRSGPYRFVRHPGYTGFILNSIGAPLLLGSAPALAAGLVAAGLMVVRTVLEDRMLRAELPGYAEYAEQVRRRLVPLVW